MMQRLAPLVLATLFAATVLAGCDDSDGSDAAASPTATATIAAATATPTATASPEPTASATPLALDGRVAGLAVLAGDVATGGEDAVEAPPSEWMENPDSQSFPRAFSHADWILHGVEGRHGTVGADGRFSIEGLAPGEYTLELRKTLNGNLVRITAPLTVGDDGGAEILIQIEQGQVRTISTYTADGRQVREVEGPDDSRAVIEDGRVVEVRDPTRHLRDPDGDGRFVFENCQSTHLWLCGDVGGSDCGDGRECRCTASCPLCEDCGPPVCTPPVPFNPYRCEPSGGCQQPGDVCTCVSSCPECDDCAEFVCVPSCEPAAIDLITLHGAEEVVAGRRGSLRAIARLETGGEIDVTYLAAWSSSAPEIATVDAWGNVMGVAPGTATITATFNDIASAPYPVVVTETPGVSQIEVQLRDCIVPLGLPDDAPAIVDDFFPYPVCREVVRVGRDAWLVAFVTYTDDTLEILTEGVDWAASPASVGTVDAGRFTAAAAGTASITASLGGVTSNPLELRVVDQATVVQLTIHPEYGVEPPIFFPAFEDDPAVALPPADCFDCYPHLTLLVGDTRRFRATARYDTGEWDDVTDDVAWSSSDSTVASIDAAGELVAAAAGTTAVSATLGEVVSNEVTVDVVAEATLLDLYVYPEGNDRVVGTGGEASFRAQGHYDIGFARDVTEEVAWQTSDSAVGSFTAPGIFTGHAAGDVELWAELDGVSSSRLRMEVFATSEIDYCDPDDVNRASWSDAYNRVVLESDCHEYVPPDVVELRFTVTERERPIGIFDPCLDLWVYQGDRRIRTIREEGCGEPFLAPGSPDLADEAPRYQLRAFWDLKDDAGNLVVPGVYTVVGRFYLYYDPVVRLQVAVTAPDGLIPCTPNDCGNGCGYVRACGDDGPPLECPAVCTSICECPPGWGITEADACEPCPLECCPPNARCTPDIPPCEVEPRCCPPGEPCIDILPSCETDCCPSPDDCAPDQSPCADPQPPCVVTGCSGQICASEPMASTCEFLPEYACYRTARCAVQSDGACGWTPTDELQRCLDDARLRTP